MILGMFNIVAVLANEIKIQLTSKDTPASAFRVLVIKRIVM